MKYSYEKVNSNTGRLYFEIPAEDLQAAAHKEYLSYRTKASVPGFRRGKTPRKVFETYYGDIFNSMAKDQLIDDSYREALKADAANPVGAPSLVSSDVAEDGTFKFVIEFPVIPDVELGEYMGLEADYVEQTYEDRDIDAAVEQFVQNHMRTETITDRPAMFGDTVTIDYAGTIDGEAFPGGTAKNYKLEIGSGAFIAGFEDQVIGMVKDEEKDINVTFPEDYHSKDVAGKPAVFHVILHEIQKKELPELNDEFIADTTEFSTVAEYRADVEKKIQESVANANDEARRQAVMNAAVDNASCDIPEALVEEQAKMLKEQYDRSLRQQGLSLDLYLQFSGIDKDEFENVQIKGTARRQIKEDLVLEAIIEKENPEVTDELREEEIALFAASRNMTVEKFKEMYEKQLESTIDHNIKVKEVLKKMVESATLHPVADKLEDDDADENEAEEASDSKEDN